MNQTLRVSWPLRHRGRLACTRSLERRTAGSRVCPLCYTSYRLLTLVSLMVKIKMAWLGLAQSFIILFTSYLISFVACALRTTSQ